MENWTCEEIKNFNKKCDNLRKTILNSFERFCDRAKILIDKHNKNIRQRLGKRRY